MLLRVRSCAVLFASTCATTHFSDFICSIGPPKYCYETSHSSIRLGSFSVLFPQPTHSLISISLFLSLSPMHHREGGRGIECPPFLPSPVKFQSQAIAERGYCVPLTRNALASLVKEKASHGQEFGGISRSVGEIFSGDGMRRRFRQERESLPKLIFCL